MHAEHLEAVHGVGPHTISVPRIKHADDIDPGAFVNAISDEIFCKIAAALYVLQYLIRECYSQQGKVKRRRRL